METANITDGAVGVLDGVATSGESSSSLMLMQQNDAKVVTVDVRNTTTEPLQQKFAKVVVAAKPGGDSAAVQTKSKRKHRRGKPKAKNSNKPYKKTNWTFQMPRSYSNPGNKCGGGRRGKGANPNGRVKLVRSRSLVPYNTNKFLMEEHMAEVPSALLTPSGRTRDSSFSVDSEDNYLYSLPQDEEEFLTKEFANVYEKARVERLENLTKQQLIEECLQIEDRYSDQGREQQQQRNIQTITSEFLYKIRCLEDKIRDLTRENYELRCQLSVLSVEVAPKQNNSPPMPMDSSSSEDSESDSSSSSSSSSQSSLSEYNNVCVQVGVNFAEDDEEQRQDQLYQMDSDEVEVNHRNGDCITNGYHHDNSSSPREGSVEAIVDFPPVRRPATPTSQAPTEQNSRPMCE